MTRAARLRSALRAFAHDLSATSAVLFALSALPVIGVVGLGLDYYNGLVNKTRLDDAADAAAIAAITTAQNYYSANSAFQTNPTLGNNAAAAGQAQGYKVFYSNAGRSQQIASAVPTVALPPPSGQTFTATVTYTGSVPARFGQLFGVPSLHVSGKAASSLTMGSYLDFYLVLDMSGSMGLPTSTAGQQQLMAINPDDRGLYPSGCQFACHFAGYQGYTVAHQNGITLRVDSVGKAVQNLIQTANATMTLKNQYRIGVYPFIDNVMQAAAISSNFAAATLAAGQLGDVYLDSGLSNPLTLAMGSGGTHFENVFPGMGTYINTIGNGSSPSSPKPFLFLVTDGADNNQYYYGGGVWTGSQPQAPTNFGYCQYAQQHGVTVAILYIPYQQIYDPNPSFAGDEDDRVNAVIPSIQQDLQSCATPGFFFTANSDADINNAMQTMFAQALQAARLTQ